MVVMLTIKAADMLGYHNVPFHDLAWTWYVLVGTVICFSVGYAVSALFPGQSIATEENYPVEAAIE